MRSALAGGKTFNALFLEALREGLSVMLDETAARNFLAHLEESVSIRPDEVVEKSEVISRELEKVFGVGAARIENVVAALLFSKVGLEFESKGANLGDYIQYARIHGSIPTKAEGPATRLDAIDMQIIDSLRRDARKPVLQISKETGVSRPTVTNRLNRLIDSNILSVNACLNLGELNFKTSLIALEAKGSEARQELEKTLSICPRVLMLLRPPDKANMVIMLCGEDQNTLSSTIETFRSIRNTDLVYIHSSDPPLFAESFCLKVFPIKGDVAPCGKRCADCLHFLEGQCVGCPAVAVYKGPL